MDAYILIHETYTVPGVVENWEIISGYSSLHGAEKGFNLYLDTLEATWKESYKESLNAEILKIITFNRFSEPTDNYVFSAQTGYGGDFVCIKKIELE